MGKVAFTPSIILLVLIALTQACQTTSGYLTPHLPAGISDYFHSCSQGDGSVHMRLRKEGDYIGDVNLEWFAVDGRPFIYQVYEPLGRTVLSIQYDKGRRFFLVTGSWSSALPPLNVDEDGFLLLDQKRIGVKYAEIPCFLQFKFPTLWLRKVTRQSADEEGVRLQVTDDSRSIKLSLRHAEARKPQTVCAHIEWKSYWGIVTSTYELCYDYNNRHKGMLSGLSGYSLEWTDDEGT